MIRCGAIALAAILGGMPVLAQDSRSKTSGSADPFGSPGEVVSRPSLPRPEVRIPASTRPDVSPIQPAKYTPADERTPEPIALPIARPTPVPAPEPVGGPRVVTSPGANCDPGTCPNPRTAAPKQSGPTCLDRISEWLFYRPAPMPCNCGSRSTPYIPTANAWFANRRYEPTITVQTCAPKCQPQTPEPRPIVSPTSNVIGQVGQPSDPVPLNGRSTTVNREAPQNPTRGTATVGTTPAEPNPLRAKAPLSPYAPNDYERR